VSCDGEGTFSEVIAQSCNSALHIGVLGVWLTIPLMSLIKDAKDSILFGCGAATAAV
jgi:hypothetical protein